MLCLRRALAPLVLAAGLISCSGDSSTGPKIGPPVAVQVLSGNGQSAEVGTRLPNPLVVKVTDANGSPVPGVSVAWSAVSGTLSTSSSATAVDGTTSAEWTIGAKAGDHSATATVADVGEAAFGATGRAGAPALLRKVSGDAQVGVAAKQLANPLVVRIEDKHGNAVAGVPVSWTSKTGTVTAENGNSDSEGTAKATWVLGTTAGAHSATAVVSDSISTAFTAKGEAGAPSRIEVTSGDGQTGTVGAALAKPLVVKVSDKHGNAVRGVSVAWSVTSGGGAFSSASSSTDSAGAASSTWTLGNTAGTNGAKVAADGVGSVSFSATGKAGAVASVALSPASVAIRVGEAVTLVATLQDAFGNIVADRRPIWNSSDPSVAVVDQAGKVIGVQAGSTSITAKSEGQTGAAAVFVTPAQMNLSVKNLLVSPIKVAVNQVPIGTVAANSTSTFTIAKPTALQVAWDIVRPTTRQGSPIGEDVGGVFENVLDPAPSMIYEVDNSIGSQTVFAPFISNNTSVGLLMGVNMGLSGEMRCECVVGPNTSDVYIGYYTLYSNSNVRAYADGSGYTGGYVYWPSGTATIGSLMASGSGRVNLWTNVMPSLAGVAGMSSSVSSLGDAPPRAADAIRNDKPNR